MRCMERANRLHGGRRGRDHAVGAARRRSRDRSGGSKACRPDQRPARCQARNPVAAPGPSIPRRSRRFPSMSAPHDASVSWLRSCLLLFVAVLFVDCLDNPEFPSPVRAEASESRSFHGFVRGMYQPPENPKACANEPKPPRVTPLEVALEVPDAAWLDEESLE